MKPHPEIMPWFMGLWIALGVVGLWNAYFDKNIARKKRLMPIIIVGAGVIFAAFTTIAMGDLRMALFVAPFVALITWLNLRLIRICLNCGRTIHSGMWFTKAEYCPKCGARLGTALRPE